MAFFIKTLITIWILASKRPYSSCCTSCSCCLFALIIAMTYWLRSIIHFLSAPFLTAWICTWLISCCLLSTTCWHGYFSAPHMICICTCSNILYYWLFIRTIFIFTSLSYCPRLGTIIICVFHNNTCSIIGTAAFIIRMASSRFSLDYLFGSLLLCMAYRAFDYIVTCFRTSCCMVN